MKKVKKLKKEKSVNGENILWALLSELNQKELDILKVKVIIGF